MDAILDTIRIAMTDGASDDERRRGAAACRALADALDHLGGFDIAPTAHTASLDGVIDVPCVEVPTPGEPAHVGAPAVEAVAVAPEAATGPAAPPTNTPLAANPFAGMTADQILELAIATLRSSAGDEPLPPPAGSPFRLTLVPVPRRS